MSKYRWVNALEFRLSCTKPSICDISDKFNTMVAYFLMRQEAGHHHGIGPSFLEYSGLSTKDPFYQHG